MPQYRDGMGRIYEVPAGAVAEFERRRGICLRIAIVGKLIIIGLFVWFHWHFS